MNRPFRVYTDAHKGGSSSAHQAFEPIRQVLECESASCRLSPFSTRVSPLSTILAVVRSLLASFLLLITLEPASLSGSQRIERPQTILGQGTLKSLAISPSRRHIASVGGGGTFLWSLTTGKQLQTFPHGKDFLYDVAFSGDSKRIISVGTPKTTVWNIDTLLPEFTLPGGNGSGVALSESGNSLILRLPQDAQVWNTTTGLLLLQLAHPDIRAIDIDQSGKIGVTVGADKNAVIWDLTTGIPLHTLKHPEPLFFAALSPDASKLVTGAQAQVWIWDTSTGLQLEHLENTRSAVLASNNISLATKGADRNADLWLTDPSTKLFDLIGNDNPLETVWFSPGDAWIVGRGRENTWLWDPESGDLNLQVAAHTPQFSPDGSVFLARKNSGDFELWETKPTGKIRTISGHTSGRYLAHYSPTGHQIAVVDSARITLYEPTGLALNTLQGHDSLIHSTNYSPDGTRLLSASEDGKVILWDTQSGLELQSMNPPSRTGFARFAPDGLRAITVGEDGNVAIWNQAFTNIDHRVDEHEDPIRALAINQSLQTIATGDDDGMVIVKDTLSGELLHSLDVEEPVFSLAFTPRGTRLFIGTRQGPSFVFDLVTRKHSLTIETGPAWSASISPDGETVLIAGASTWDLTTGEKRHSFELDDRNGANADGVTFSPDGLLIAGTGSLFDASSRVWHAKTGKLLYTFDRHEGAATSIQFSPDGRSLLTAANDGRAMIWKLEPGPNLHVEQLDAQISISWDQGSIESAPSPSGPWVSLPSQISPLAFPKTTGIQFFRVVQE
jgi:WD40 repeat protein